MPRPRIPFVLLILALALCVLPTVAQTPKPKPARDEPGSQEEERQTAEAEATGREVPTRFTDHSDGTATDTQSGLMWTTRDNGSNIDWNDSGQYCSDLSLAGHTGWRLPTIYELEQLYIEELSSSCGGSTCHVYPPFELSEQALWSSTKEGSLSAVFTFGSGQRGSVPLGVSDGLRVLCVRRSGW